jgi:hypothetical protein
VGGIPLDAATGHEHTAAVPERLSLEVKKVILAAILDMLEPPKVPGMRGRPGTAVLHASHIVCTLY